MVNVWSSLANTTLASICIEQAVHHFECTPKWITKVILALLGTRQIYTYQWINVISLVRKCSVTLVVVIVWKTTYQGKVFPNAGPMAKSKGKVDKGTRPADLVRYIWELLSVLNKVFNISHFLFAGSNLSGLKTSGSTKCSGIRHIVPVLIWKKNCVATFMSLLSGKGHVPT